MAAAATSEVRPRWSAAESERSELGAAIAAMKSVGNRAALRFTPHRVHVSQLASQGIAATSRASYRGCVEVIGVPLARRRRKGFHFDGVGITKRPCQWAAGTGVTTSTELQALTRPTAEPHLELHRRTNTWTLLPRQRPDELEPLVVAILAAEAKWWRHARCPLAGRMRVDAGRMEADAPPLASGTRLKS